MDVHVSSRKARSCVTINTVSFFSILSICVRWCMPCRSRWLVGSSSRSTSGDWRKAEARATRLRSPPDRLESGWGRRECI
mmetsp:Transcript_12768/g.18192  ORF Transcript_12768/g.18192 Transcript_12768/m.18192 type:complete len:80 (-) Transcript_12768:741-980(-)